MTNDIEVTPRELIIIAKPEAQLRISTEGVASLARLNVAPLNDLVMSLGLKVKPLFGHSEERIINKFASMEPLITEEARDLSIYYHVEAPDEELDELANSMRPQAVVEAAYVKPPGELPLAPDEPTELINEMMPSMEDAPPATPNFTSRQKYLDPAPAGIDARYAWTKSGGTGTGVNIIDLEWGWRFTHEDLTQNQGGVVDGINSTSSNHGTAVIGEFSGDNNSIGITGICPDARVSAISFTSNPSATAINKAANRLRPGDIMLLEIHRAGPRHNFQGRNDQKGYVAIEWWPDDYAAIRSATKRGIIVVEAAGNGRENLDDPIYDVNPAPPNGPFPSWWINPYKRNPLDSGAIVVGAGAPPPGTHGRNHGPDRSRLDFSNYGSLVDAQGWGREVTTCGYGDLQGGSDPDLWYTDTFSGTSSASPIVVGALGCVQGFNRAKNKPLLTPEKARTMLRDTGSPQQNAPTRPATQRIGNRPNLRQLIIDCFIASAAYGSGLAPEVQLLREFRDNVLLKSRYRRAFEGLLEIYYSFSPPIAQRMENNEAFKDAMRRIIARPTVETLKAIVRWMESTREKDS